MNETTVAAGDQKLGKIAAGLGIAAVLSMVVLATLDHDGAGWLLMPLFGVAAVVTGYRAGGTTPRNTLAFTGLVLGAIMTAVFIAWMIFGD